MKQYCIWLVVWMCLICLLTCCVKILKFVIDVSILLLANLSKLIRVKMPLVEFKPSISCMEIISWSFKARRIQNIRVNRTGAIYSPKSRSGILNECAKNTLFKIFIRQMLGNVVHGSSPIEWNINVERYTSSGCQYHAIENDSLAPLTNCIQNANDYYIYHHYCYYYYCSIGKIKMISHRNVADIHFYQLNLINHYNS